MRFCFTLKNLDLGFCFRANFRFLHDCFLKVTFSKDLCPSEIQAFCPRSRPTWFTFDILPYTYCYRICSLDFNCFAGYDSSDFRLSGSATRPPSSATSSATKGAIRISLFHLSFAIYLFLCYYYLFQKNTYLFFYFLIITCLDRVCNLVNRY